jgi:molecular chaperone GrpE
MEKVNEKNEEVLETSEEEQQEQQEQQEQEETTSEEKVEEVSAVEKFEEALNESKDKYLRLQAEFQNYKKRQEKQRKDLIKYSHGEVIKDVLPIIDNFERAIVSLKEDKNAESLLEGIEMIKSSFDEFLEKNKVETIDTVGEKFDTKYHHAVMKEDTDAYDHNEVIQELQRGYILEGKVIRHAMVKVASNKENKEN